MQFLLTTSYLILICFVFSGLGCFTKKRDIQQSIQPAALQQDFDILTKTLKEAHRGLYWYSDSTTMSNYLDSTEALLDHDMTRIVFFKKLLPVIANIKCVHTTLRLPSSEVTNQFQRMLPFDFFCQNGKIYIQKGLHSKGHEGVEILSINNIETKTIVETLLNSIPADGYNETFKYQLLSKGAFREGYALFFGQPTTFTIQAIDQSNHQLHSFTVAAISPQKIYAIPTAPLPPFALHFHQNTAILTINTFEVNTIEFGNSIAAFFQTIAQQGTKHLIIDLRRNGGGTNDNVSVLYSFIASSPFVHLKRAEINAAPLTYSQFITNYQATGTFKKSKDNIRIHVVNDRYAGTSERNPADKNVFKGNVAVLTSGNTTSAASEFAAIARYLKRASIVGEETGGCYYGATGGIYLNLKLPNSGLEVRIPTIRIFTAVREDFHYQPKGHGTLPDYPIQPSIRDIIAKKDVQLEKALAILAR